MKTIYIALATGLLAGTLGFLAGQGQSNALQREAKALRATLAQAQAQPGAADTPGNDPAEITKLRAEAREVHKLRAEVSQLRGTATNATRLEAENARLKNTAQAATRASAPSARSPGSPPREQHFPKENWAFQGYDTPEAALQSIAWAMREGDAQTFLASLAPDDQAAVQQEWANLSESEILARTQGGTQKVNSLQILETETVSDQEVVLRVYASNGEDKVQKVTMVRQGNEWRLANFAK